MKLHRKFCDSNELFWFPLFILAETATTTTATNSIYVCVLYFRFFGFWLSFGALSPNNNKSSKIFQSLNNLLVDLILINFLLFLNLYHIFNSKTKKKQKTKQTKYVRFYFEILEKLCSNFCFFFALLIWLFLCLSDDQIKMWIDRSSITKPTKFIDFEECMCVCARV